MHISKQLIKPFPEYEDIFYDDLEQHKSTFTHLFYKLTMY